MKRILLVFLVASVMVACNNSADSAQGGKSDTSANTPSEADIAKDLQQMADSPDHYADSLTKVADTLKKLIPMPKR